MSLRRLTLLSVSVALLVTPAFAHHSFAMFDAAKTVTLTGTVKEFEWLNPHSWVHLSIVGENKAAETWSFESGSTGQMVTSGWSRDSLKVGDKISIDFHPLRDGSNGGQLLAVTLPDGRKLCQGAACRAAATAR